MIERLYNIISNKLLQEYNLHIGLLVTDKLVIVLPVDVMNEHCSEVFDLIYTISAELEIKRKDISDYIDYKTEDDIDNLNIKWFN